MTQQDIARHLNITEMTVYRCLNNKGKVSAKTREKIENFIKENNYQVNHIARSLVCKKTFIIGVLVPSFSSSFYPEIIESVQGIFRDNSYNILLSCSNENINNEAEALKTFNSIHVDGVLWCPVNGIDSKENYNKYLSSDLPVVLFDRCFLDDKEKYNQVITNSFEAAKTTTKFLLDNNHESIALVGVNENISFSRDIVAGYKECLNENNIKINENLIIYANNLTGIKLGRYVLDKLLNQNEKFTAIQASDDLIALGVMQRANELQLEIPENFSLTGFGGIEIIKHIATPITTVKEDKLKMAQIASNMLLENIKARSLKEDFPKQNILLDGKLLLRKSTAITKTT